MCFWPENMWSLYSRSLREITWRKIENYKLKYLFLLFDLVIESWLDALPAFVLPWAVAPIWLCLRITWEFCIATAIFTYSESLGQCIVTCIYKDLQVCLVQQHLDQQMENSNWEPKLQLLSLVDNAHKYVWFYSSTFILCFFSYTQLDYFLHSSLAGLCLYLFCSFTVKCPSLF